MARISNFTIFFVTITSLIVLIITATTININNEHEKNLIYAMQSKVEYYAKRCYLENNCKDEVNLKTLYEKGYLDEVVDPVTKEVIDYNTKIKYENEKIIIEWNNKNE